MGEPIDQQKLNELIDACWAHHAWVKGLRCNCNFKHPDPNDPTRTLPDAEFDRILPDNEIPILWFGDMEAYDASPRKIVTVGLNPSDMEFSKTRKDRDEGKSDMFRFEEARSLSGRTLDHLNEKQRDSYKRALNRYFLPKNIDEKRTKDDKDGDSSYSLWFDNWLKILLPLNASFKRENKPEHQTDWSYALHTDFCTPVATSPAWSAFQAKRPCVLGAIFQDAKERRIWTQLIEILSPQLILAVVGEDKMKQMAEALGLKDYQFSAISRKGAKELKLFHWKGNVAGHDVHLFGSPQKVIPWGGWYEPQIREAKELIEKSVWGDSNG